MASPPRLMMVFSVLLLGLVPYISSRSVVPGTCPVFPTLAECPEGGEDDNECNDDGDCARIKAGTKCCLDGCERRCVPPLTPPAPTRKVVPGTCPVFPTPAECPEGSDDDNECNDDGDCARIKPGTKCCLDGCKRRRCMVDRVFRKVLALDCNRPGRTKNVPRNCDEVLQNGCRKSGVYFVDPDGKGTFKVYCDQTTTGGGWTVFQRREDDTVDFYRGWNDYKNGFGNLKGEFWLGLDKIHRLTHQARNRLRVELEDFKGMSAYAEYGNFAVSSEQRKYKLLSLGTYRGTAGDALSYHRGYAFSTKDRDNDNVSWNCAASFKGAWWHTDCHSTNLNGLYHHGGEHNSYADGINWLYWKGYKYSAKRAEMKMRRAYW